MSTARKLSPLGLACAAALLALIPATAGASATARATDEPASGCGQAPAQLRYVTTVTVDGQPRTALIDIPPGQPAGARLPVVLVFHGAGGSATGVEGQTGLTPLGHRYGFMAVYPNASGHYWHLNGRQDFEFVRALLDQLDDTLCVDDSRVYATGVSNGASLVSRLGCVLSDRLTAIAPVAGDDSLYPGCQPHRDVSVLEIHGSADLSVYYQQPSGWGVWGFLGAWSLWDQCPATPLVWQRLATHVLYAARSGCADGAAIAHIKLLGEPHAWPSLPTAHSSGSGVAFSARQAVWQFFSNRTVLPQGA